MKCCSKNFFTRLCVKALFREILLTRNFMSTQAYVAAPGQQLDSKYRGIMFATTDNRDEREFTDG